MELVFRRFDIDNNNKKLINYESLISVLKDEHYDIKIISNTCIGEIGVNQSCSIKLTTSINNLFNGVINLLDENNNIVGTVGVTTFSNNLSTNNNGGCSFVINSSDYSLITLLVICFFIILFKKRCKKK